MCCGLKIELCINRVGGCGEIVAEMARNGLRFGDLDYRKSEKGRLKGGHALWEWSGRADIWFSLVDLAPKPNQFYKQQWLLSWCLLAI